MSEPVDIVFRIRPEDVGELLAALKAEPDLKPTVVEAAGTGGGGELATVLIELAPHTLTFALGVITAWLSRTGASIEYDNMKITNVSRSVVEDIIRKRLGAPTEASKKQEDAERK